MLRRDLVLFSLLLLALTACGGPLLDDGGVPLDDAGMLVEDAGALDDAGMLVEDAGALADAGVDAGAPVEDGGYDGGSEQDDAGFDAGPSYVDIIDHTFLIEHFGGDPVDAFDYADDVDGFQQYLDDVGVTYFSADEIVTPNNPSAAAGCGYMILLPERGLWERIGALALFSDQLRALVGEPVFMRNWWRPDCYNTAVGGAPGGDHPDADAVDLDFQSATSRAAAQQYLCEAYWSQDIVGPDEIAPGSDLDPRLNLSVGLGGLTIHLGVLSANGRRHWKYGSYTQEPNSGDCW
jgi:hypothetical protein